MKNETARREIESLDYYLQNHTNDYSEESHMAMMMAIKALEQQPCEDCISRKEALRHRHIIYDDDGVGYSVVRVDEIEQLPSVTPKPCEEENPNCTECRYYDKEKHHCPRFCKVIEETMTEITSEQPKWIPCSERLPEEAGVYLVSMYRLGYPQREVDGFACGRWERFGNDVIAWCEIPEPYGGEGE